MFCFLLTKINRGLNQLPDIMASGQQKLAKPERYLPPVDKIFKKVEGER
jgi:hypothetical protein